MDSLAVGFGLGFLVALQVGPMSLFLVRSTLRGGIRVGLAIGAGIAAIDATYASLGAAGAAPVVTIAPLRVALGLVGAGVLVWLGARTFMSAFRVRAGLEAPADVISARRAFATSLGATASNPATIVSWAAIFAATSSVTDGGVIPLVAGVGLGSLTWVVVLACAVALVRQKVGPGAIAAADAVAGVGLLGFGGALGYRTVQAH